MLRSQIRGVSYHDIHPCHLSIRKVPMAPILLNPRTEIQPSSFLPTALGSGDVYVPQKENILNYYQSFSYTGIPQGYCGCSFRTTAIKQYCNNVS